MLIRRSLLDGLERSLHDPGVVVSTLLGNLDPREERVHHDQSGLASGPLDASSDDFRPPEMANLVKEGSLDVGNAEPLPLETEGHWSLLGQVQNRTASRLPAKEGLVLCDRFA